MVSERARLLSLNLSLSCVCVCVCVCICVCVCGPGPGSMRVSPQPTEQLETSHPPSSVYSERRLKMPCLLYSMYIVYVCVFPSSRSSIKEGCVQLTYHAYHCSPRVFPRSSRSSNCSLTLPSSPISPSSPLTHTLSSLCCIRPVITQR